MKKFTTLCALIAMTSAIAADTPPPEQSSQRGEAAGYASRDATVLSVMGWGISLAVGIAALCALIDNSTSHAH